MRSPLLYQISARDWLSRLAHSNGGAIAFDAIPDAELDAIRDRGFDWLYLLGVWQTGAVGQRISRENPAWRPGYTRALSGFDESAVSGSPFAIQSYVVHADFGGPQALAHLRGRLARRGIQLMLDFVPNHVAIDHPWAVDHPDRLMRGSEADLQREPANYVRFAGNVFAHGRDPYFPGWVDTVQLDYSKAETGAAMAGELRQIAAQCDGVRCDMAMLVLPQIFERTWGRQMPGFWPEAIAGARAVNARFLMMAEVYWGLEWELQQQGFDYTYDKTLYDRLLGEDAEPVRAHLTAPVNYQNRLARFLENHDEPRVAEELSFDHHRAAALIAYSVPGLRFFHDGQLAGAVREPSIHLGRREREPINPQIAGFYRWLLPLLRDRIAGDWRLLNVHSAWEGNSTASALIAIRRSALVIVNFSPHRSQGYVQLDGELDSMPDHVELTDSVTGQRYTREKTDLRARGLYVDLPAWGTHLFVFDGNGAGI